MRFFGERYPYGKDFCDGPVSVRLAVDHHGVLLERLHDDRNDTAFDRLHVFRVICLGAHEEFLKVWFSTNKPKWSPKYYIANNVVNTNGDIEQWVTSSLNLSLVDGDKVLKVVQVHDALITDGKVQKFYVYERIKQDNE